MLNFAIFCTLDMLFLKCIWTMKHLFACLNLHVMHCVDQ